MFEKFKSALESGRIEELKFYIRENRDINIKNEDGTTLLHLAIKKGDIKVVELLLVEGAYINVKDKDGKTPLGLATSKEIKALLKMNLDLLKATKKNDMPKIRSLLEKGACINVQDKDGETPLMRAVKGSHTEVAKFLIDNGAKVNKLDNVGFTALQRAIIGKNEEMIKLLLNGGSDINGRSGYFNHVAYMTVMRLGRRGIFPLPPLLLAIEVGDIGTVKLLLEKGVSINARDGGEDPPLMKAVRKGHTEIAKFLIDNGAKVNEVDNEEFTPLQCAIIDKNEEMIKLLLNGGSDINGRDRYVNHVARMEVMPPSFSPLLSPLFLAIEVGDIGVVKLFLEKGVDISVVNQYEGTSLHYAVKHKNETAIKLLLEKGANIDARDRGGNTPLMVAVQNRCMGSAKVLIKYTLLKNQEAEKAGYLSSCVKSQ